MWKKYLTILFVFCFLLTGCEKRDENTENMDQSFILDSRKHDDSFLI